MVGIGGVGFQLAPDTADVDLDSLMGLEVGVAVTVDSAKDIEGADDLAGVVREVCEDLEFRRAEREIVLATRRDTTVEVEVEDEVADRDRVRGLSRVERPRTALAFEGCELGGEEVDSIGFAYADVGPCLKCGDEAIGMWSWCEYEDDPGRLLGGEPNEGKVVIVAWVYGENDDIRGELREEALGIEVVGSFGGGIAMLGERWKERR